MALDGSDVTPLTSTPEDEGRPALSADGRRMLFYRVVGAERHVFLARYDGTDAVRMPELDDITDYALSPDGSRVAFVARVADVDRVMVMDVSGSNAVPVSPADLRTVSSPKFIPGSDPLRVVFTSFQDLWQVNADGTSPVLLAELDDWIHSVPVSIATAPDGARIAFGCQPEAHVRDMCVMNADGTSPVRLTADLAPDGGAVFAPDGRVVFNRSEDVTADSEIWAINVDGTGLVNLSNSPSSHEFTSR
jgi:Tol biopolymer transport system component